METSGALVMIPQVNISIALFMTKNPPDLHSVHILPGDGLHSVTAAVPEGSTQEVN